ncbi:hypothetical protein [uncultured Duncaniella sp.]|uniref:hypothetical protein n=1 Tax=uncultured Duncaniella sp. TaxID=2768039 RepID=UPI00321F678F
MDDTFNILAPTGWVKVPVCRCHQERFASFGTGAEIAEWVPVVESAALDERVHECGVLGSSLAADVLVVLKAQLYRFHPLFAQVV